MSDLTEYIKFDLKMAETVLIFFIFLDAILTDDLVKVI